MRSRQFAWLDVVLSLALTLCVLLVCCLFYICLICLPFSYSLNKIHTPSFLATSVSKEVQEKEEKAKWSHSPHREVERKSGLVSLGGVLAQVLLPPVFGLFSETRNWFLFSVCTRHLGEKKKKKVSRQNQGSIWTIFVLLYMSVLSYLTGRAWLLLYVTLLYARHRPIKLRFQLRFQLR